MGIIKQSYNSWDGGYWRFKHIEINWSLFEWALPLHVDFRTKNLGIITILCVTFFFIKTK